MDSQLTEYNKTQQEEENVAGKQLPEVAKTTNGAGKETEAVKAENGDSKVEEAKK